jgi:putative transposase
MVLDVFALLAEDHYIMARPLRIDIEDGWYHITSRGTDRRQIFDGGRDNEHFIELLEECSARYSLLLHAYCLMGSHYHLLVQAPHGNVSKAMQWLNVSYGMWYNRKHDRVGPLFQGRFGSKLVDGEGAWALELSVYMHLNPVRIAGLGLGKRDKKTESLGWKQPSTEQVKERLSVLRGYKWSSYRAYAGYEVAPKWLSTGVLWRRSRVGKVSGKAGYRKIVADRLKCGTEEAGIENIKTCLAIGSTQFIERVSSLVKGDRKEQPELRKWQRLTPFESVVKALEETRGQKWEDMKNLRGDPGKGIALLLGRRFCGLSLRELGEAVGGMEYHAVSKALSRVDKKAKKDRKLRTLIARTERAVSNV